MMELTSPGVVLRLPSNWEAEIDAGSGEAEAGSVSLATPRVHIGNFPLPLERGDFGSGAVERMGTGDVLICLLEETPSVIGTRLFKDEGMPTIANNDSALLPRWPIFAIIASYRACWPGLSSKLTVTGNTTAGLAAAGRGTNSPCAGFSF